MTDKHIKNVQLHLPLAKCKLKLWWGISTQRMTKTKNDTTKCWWGCEKTGSLYMAGGNVKWCPDTMNLR